MGQIISVVVRNNSGVLARISSLFGRRGYNIDSLTVSATDDPQISRVTVAINGCTDALEQVCKQTAKLIDVIAVQELKEEDCVARELLLVKLLCTSNCIERYIVASCDTYGASILDISGQSVVVELTGTSKKIDEFTECLVDGAEKYNTYKVSKVCRTGVTALKR